MRRLQTFHCVLFFVRRSLDGMDDLIVKYIDVKKTKSAVFKRLKRYKTLLLLEPVRSMPSVTQSFSFIPPATNVSLNAVENAAEKNIEKEKMFIERQAVMEQLHNAVDNLRDKEKYLIVEGFLQEDNTPDVEIYTNLGICRTDYYKLKQCAIVRLGFYLGIEVYKEDEE